MRIFDSHFHIIDPRFPLIPNDGYLPDPFLPEDYRARTAAYDVIGGALVSGSFQGFDQTYLLDSLRRLGPGFVGVAQLPADASDEQIQELHSAGVRAVRFNIRRGGAEVLNGLEVMARRVYDLVGWHSEFYVAASDLPELFSRLSVLPRICIDHMGLTQEGFATLLKLVEQGTYVKATGFGRVDFAIPPALRAIYAANPAALIFATDLPCPRAPRPFRDEDVTLILETLGEQASQRVFSENALALYYPD